MKIGALASSLRRPLLETFDVYREMGLQGVQIGVNEEFLALPEDKIEEIKASCAKNGLTISAVCGDIGGHAFQTRGENMKRAAFLCRVVDLAVRIGTHVITTHIGVVPEDKKDPVYPLMLESIRHAACFAAGKGVTFAIETGPEKPETLKAFIEDVGSEGLGVNLDPANLRMVSCVDPVHAVEVLGRYIVHTHAKDGVNLFPGSAAAAYGMVNPDNFLYLPSLISGVALAIALVVAVLNLAKRVYEIIFMYFVMPMSMSTLPLDDGARFKTWRETFITKIVIAYGTVFSVNIFVLLLPLITRMRIDEISGFGNSMFLIFMIVGGAMVIPAGQALFCKLFGQADDMHAGGNFLRSAFYGSRMVGAATFGLAHKIIHGGASVGKAISNHRKNKADENNGGGNNSDKYSEDKTSAETTEGSESSGGESTE